MPDQTIMPETMMRQAIEILASHLGDETVMMDVERGRYYGLNVTASRIWDILAQPTTVSGLCDQMVREFAVSRHQCEQEIFAFLGELLSRGLVQAER